MGMCCVQKGTISIETNNIYIHNKIDKNTQKENNNLVQNENNKKNNDEYSSGPILKLLIEKSQNKIEEKSEEEN